MNVPFIKYIESLVIARKPFEEIFQIVKELDVAMSSLFESEDIMNVCQTIWNSNPEYFHDPNALPDLDWLRAADDLKMVAYLMKLETNEGISGIPGAFEILHDKNMYQTMSALALASVTDEDIELIINAKYNIHYETADIKEFLRYFFNVEEWSITDKRGYVSFVSDPRLKKYYELALDGDKDYLIWKLGIAPEKSFDAMLREMGSDCYYNFKEKMKANPDESQKWGTLALRIVDRLEKLNEANDEKRSIVEDIEFTLQGTLKRMQTNEIKKGLASSGIPLVSEVPKNTPKLDDMEHIDDLFNKGEVAVEK